MRHRALQIALLAGTCGAIIACEERRDTPAPEVRFGVFYGGQIQRRTTIPFILDDTRLRIGFRVKLSEPANRARKVRWEIDMPGRRIRGKDGKVQTLRRTRLGHATLPAGQRELTQLTPFEPGDRIGTWEFRLWVGRPEGAPPDLLHAFEVVKP